MADNSYEILKKAFDLIGVDYKVINVSHKAKKEKWLVVKGICDAITFGFTQDGRFIGVQ